MPAAASARARSGRVAPERSARTVVSSRSRSAGSKAAATLSPSAPASATVNAAASMHRAVMCEAEPDTPPGGPTSG